MDKCKATRFFEVASEWVVKAAELVKQDQDGVVISFQISSGPSSFDSLFTCSLNEY